MGENFGYWSIINEMPAGMARDVMAALTGHIGSEARLERRKLVAALRRMPDYQDKAWVRLDRMVRKAIAELQENGYPVLSDSGKGGYWLASNREEIEGMCKEIESRVEKLKDKARALRTAGKLAWQDETQAKQMRLDV